MIRPFKSHSTVLCIAALLIFVACKRFESVVETGDISPRVATTLEPIPAAPNYSDERAWAALPWTEDTADETPRGQVADAGPGTADVFYLHPTMYEVGLGWNAPIDSAALNEAVDEWPVRHQASIFNGAGRIFAPRYRQAHIRVFSIGDSLSGGALRIAYADVRDAFQHFLANWDEGRPLVIAAHSQGSWHARWLLQEFFDDRPLADRLVAAYIPGMDIYPSDFQSLKPCQKATDQACYCTWMSYGNGYLPGWLQKTATPPSAIHPITWTAKPGVSNARGEHLGAVRESFRIKNAGSITAKLAPEGVLSIDPPHIFLVGRRIHRDNWHVGDFNLFWSNVRANVHERIETHERQQ